MRKYLPGSVWEWFLFLPMAVCLSLGLILVAKNLYALSTYEGVSGIVKKNELIFNPWKSDSYIQLVEFRASDQKDYFVETKVRTLPAPSQVGERVLVYYKKASPEEAFVYSFTENWLAPFILSFIGGPMLFIWMWAKR